MIRNAICKEWIFVNFFYKIPCDQKPKIPKKIITIKLHY